MAEFLLAAAALVLLTVAVALARVLLGPTDAERLMSVQLLGTGGAAALLLAGTAVESHAFFDVALIMALLAAFVPVAFVKKGAVDESAYADAPAHDAGAAQPDRKA